MSPPELWQAILNEIEVSISKAEFNVWFQNTSLISLDENSATIGASSGFAKESLKNKYNHIILKTLNKFHPEITTLKFQIIETHNLSLKTSSVFEKSHSSGSNRNTHSNSFQTKKINSSQLYDSGLNLKYTFEDFVVGEHNELARAACLAVADHPGEMYNPLFIYGGVGLGKTHLLQSIGNKLLSNHPEKKVLYTTSEKFTYELISAIRNHDAERFKRNYQAIDLLIIDDVQFLAGKEKTQHEFFNIFNALYQLNKQIVISSDRPPKAIPTLEDRLRSRFEGGMIADISKPDLETRIAILNAKSTKKNMLLSEEIIHYIAENITHNIRELEGALNRVIAMNQFNASPLSLENVQRILKDIIESHKKKVLTQKEVCDIVCTYYDVSLEDLSRKGRKKEIAHPRQVTMYLLRNEIKSSYSNIGMLLGGRDHTTVLHAYEKIHKECKKEHSPIKKEVEYLLEQLYTA